jgi:hypothetical protein
LDVVDPILGVPQFRPTIEQSLRSFGVESNVTLHAGQSPEMVERLARDSGGMWSLFFIDGDHEGDAVVRDTLACLPHATQDCIILFHDLMSPDVARALPVLRDRGWNVMVYLTSQIMAVAWRGSVNPVKHTPDPAIAAMQIPDHLAGFPISGLRE